MKQYPKLPEKWQASYISQWCPMNPDNFVSSGMAWFDYSQRKYAIEGLSNPWSVSKNGYQLWISEKCCGEKAVIRRKKRLIFPDRIETELETDEYQGKHPLPRNVLEIWQARMIGNETIDGIDAQVWQSKSKDKLLYLSSQEKLPLRLELQKGEQIHVKTFVDGKITVLNNHVFDFEPESNKQAPFDPRHASVIASPYAIYEKYRKHDPVHFGVPLHKGLKGTWYIFAYDDINKALKSKSLIRKPLNKEIALVPPLYKKYESIVSQWLVFQDPPDHTRIRSTLQRAFSGRAINKMESMIEGIAKSLLTQIEGKTQVEFISEFALPLPIIVICRLLGIPEDSRKEFESLSLALLDASFSVNKKDKRVFEKAEASMQALISYFEEIIEEKITNPQDDLISLMLDKEADDILTNEEVISNCIHILNAGYETTINLISKGTYALQQDPTFYLKVKHNVENMSDLAEELLRFDGPVHMITRWASEDIKIGGQQIKQGEQIAMMLGSANRDPQFYSEPNKLRFGRKKSHLSFGGGIHHCLGAVLARLEAKVVFPLLEDFILNYKVDMKQSRPYEWNSSIVFHGFKKLHFIRK
ncbi:cytochrome P450 [Pseudoalteromonas luteoviolacea]|uniref:cytochrome P450 n=1 Tax=Pseudoalteromonas luteoviolacea TaxID=43657 RepID=UPI001F3E6529|nr:cytochrome P450 [Pseudoalteromonas luteoviolacea]MCF6439267.1 cytochrome P450 [Pseudoalteromonas luteoviolacea]